MTIIMKLEYYRYDINYNIVKALSSYSKVEIDEGEDLITFKFKNKKDYFLFKKVKYFFNDYEDYSEILRYFKSDFQTNLQWYSYMDFEQKVELLSFNYKEDFLSRKDIEKIVETLLNIMKICKNNTKINNYNDFEVYCIKYLFLLLQLKKHYQKKVIDLMFQNEYKVTNIPFSVVLENILSSREYFNFLNKIKKSEIEKFQKMLNDHNIRDSIVYLLKKNPLEFVIKFINSINEYDFDKIFYLEFFSDNAPKLEKQEKFNSNREVQWSSFNKDLELIFNEEVDIFKKTYKKVEALKFPNAPVFEPYIIELLTTKDLFIESASMKHCIKTYSWKWPKHRFFTIEFNNEKSTLEIYFNNTEFEIIQHKGRRNLNPSTEHKMLALRFCKFLNYKGVEV